MKVELWLLGADQGGRRTPVSSGYRGSFLWSSSGGQSHDATLYLDDDLRPGGHAFAIVIPHVPSYWRDIGVGRELELREGHRLVGRAIVREINRSDLPRRRGTLN